MKLLIAFSLKVEGHSESTGQQEVSILVERLDRELGLGIDFGYETTILENGPLTLLVNHSALNGTEL